MLMLAPTGTKALAGREVPAERLRNDDMAGNVSEWTAGGFVQQADRLCCAPQRDVPSEHFSRKVIKGGSHLCAPNYCLRYRPPARQSESVDTSTSHIGFRCVIRT
jgi:formylglycine-generating enzyme